MGASFRRMMFVVVVSVQSGAFLFYSRVYSDYRERWIFQCFEIFSALIVGNGMEMVR